MLVHIPIIIVGFAVLTWSADRFVVGASAAARGLGVSTLIIGLTVVGIGTSAPEMLISAIAALDGNPGLALGNAIGSNITNIALILGLTAVLIPLDVRSRIVRRELPVLLAIMLFTLFLLWDLRLGRGDGLLLLAGMALVLVWMGLQGRSDSAPDIMGAEFEADIPHMGLGRALAWVAVGLVLLLASSRVLVWSVVEVAQALGVSDLIIGLTIVALGTSLPELAASLAGARKGDYDIAIGNVIGSNMFNLLGVLGLAGAIAPMEVASVVLSRDYSVMAGVTLVFLAMAWGIRGRGRINRLEGALLLLAWIGYQGVLFLSQG